MRSRVALTLWYSSRIKLANCDCRSIGVPSACRNVQIRTGDLESLRQCTRRIEILVLRILSDLHVGSQGLVLEAVHCHDIVLLVPACDVRDFTRG